MIADCTRSLVEVERRIPTVVVTARAGGRSIVDARVREGSTWLLPHLDGRSVEIEPGEHDLVLALPSGAEVRSRFVVEEGARLQHLDFEVPAPATTRDPLSPLPPAPGPSSRVPAWVGTSGWIAAISGAGFLALGAGSGIVAWRARDDAHCDARGLCDNPGPLERANSASIVADVGFAVGGTLLTLGLAAVGVSIWGKRPSPSPTP